MRGSQVAVEPGELRELGAGGDLEVDASSRATGSSVPIAFVAGLGDLAAALGIGHLLELAGRVEHEQRAALVERVVRALERDLPVVLAALPAVFGADHGLADAAVAQEADALVGRAAGELGDLHRVDRLMVEMPQADQLERAGPDLERIVGVEVDIVAVELLVR